jgi:hypothetical protein
MKIPPINLWNFPLTKRDYMLCYKDRTFCSRSHTWKDGTCIENCSRLLTREDIDNANDLMLGIALSDFYMTKMCPLADEGEDDGQQD